MNYSLYCISYEVYLTILLLDVNNVNFTNTLPTIEKRLKNLKISMNFSVENDGRKRIGRREKFFKTNVLVPKTKNVRRWRHRSGYTYLQLSWLSHI